MTQKFLLTTLSLVSVGAAAQEKKPMNILYIMSDDHSYQTISAYNTETVPTPNIDRLAKEGALFTNSFVANSISGPSRACLLTGKHSHMNGFTGNKSVFDGAQQTFPKLLRKAGYETAVIGKWHLTSDPTGFDWSEILIGQGEYYNPRFIRNGVKVTEKGYATDIIADKTIDWIENKHDQDKPFCVLMHNKAPHRNWQPDLQDLDLYSDMTFELPETFYDDYEGREAAKTQKMSVTRDMIINYDFKILDDPNAVAKYNSAYKSMSEEQKAEWAKHYGKVSKDFHDAKLTGRDLDEWKYQQYMRDYLRVIHSVDRNIGRVLAYLEEKGLLENTIILYTSDQGFYMGEHGWFDKRFMYEESFRTPLLVRYPGGVKGKKIDGMVQNIDHAATFLDLAGAEIPADIQGESYLPLLKGEKVKDWRKTLYYHYHDYPCGHAVKKHYGVRTERYKLLHFYDDINTWELFDLKKDPQEMHNIYGQPGTEKITAKLMEELVRLQKQYDDKEALRLNNL